MDDGQEVEWVRLGQEALASLHQERFDLVILDVGLPDQNGFEICRQIRKISDIPVIFLSARGSELDRIVGLEIGGDDYVVKPFSPREVAARVRTILRRIEVRPDRGVQPRINTDSEIAPHPPTTEPRVHTEPHIVGSPGAPQAVPLAAANDLTIDPKTRKASYAGQTLKLTPIEFKLAQFFVEHPGQVFSRAQLLEAVGLFLDANYERNIDGHIKTLRAKLRDVTHDADPIVTHRGFGYSYERGCRK